MSPQRRPVIGEESRVWNLLSLENLMTRSVVHIVYWCGLGLIILGGFGAIGAAVGVALREPGLMGLFAAIPTLIGGILVMVILAVVWRSFCEFYVVIFRISDDLRALRRGYETEAAAGGTPSREASSRPFA